MTGLLLRTARPGESPGVVGGAGVAPDLVGPLLFGPHGITGLAALTYDLP